MENKKSKQLQLFAEALAEIAEKTASMLLSMQAAILFVKKEIEEECDAKSQRAATRQFN